MFFHTKIWCCIPFSETLYLRSPDGGLQLSNLFHDAVCDFLRARTSREPLYLWECFLYMYNFIRPLRGRWVKTWTWTCMYVCMYAYYVNNSIQTCGRGPLHLKEGFLLVLGLCEYQHIYIYIYIYMRERVRMFAIYVYIYQQKIVYTGRYAQK